MNRFFTFFPLFILMYIPVYSITLVQGDDQDAPRAFSVPITTQAFDPLTGMFFVGLEENPTHPTYALSKAARPVFERIEKFTPIGSHPLLSGKRIDLLTISSQPHKAPLLPLVINNERFIHVATADGTRVESTDILNDALGNPTLQIEAINASSATVFGAVSPSNNSFLQSGSGISVVKIDTTSGVLSALTLKDATTGLEGNKAAAFDITSPSLTGGGAPVTAQAPTVSLYYDAVFNRLYIGVQVTSNTTAGSCAYSVAVAQLSLDDELTFIPLAPSTAVSNGSNGIVITKSNGTPESVSSFEPKVMHTTTGPDYLIVNGGPDLRENVGNTVYALPLVNTPLNPLIHGTLAKKDAPLTQNVFTIPATASGDLPLITDAPAQVGAGALPTPPDTQITDIQVYNDTVYVSINLQPSAQTDTGLFSSQALFDAMGKIVSWTPWQYHIIPVDAFDQTTLPGGVADEGGIKFFSIDQQNGNVWVVEGTTEKTVGITSWNKGFTSTDLIQTLQPVLATGCYSVLDLAYHTYGFSGATAYRYALFGGNGTVSFVVTSQQNGVQEVSTQDFSNPGYTLVTSLPGTVRALEYSRNNTGISDNYFFAGLQEGLFVFADSQGNGFDVSSLGLLNTTPFSGRTWQRIPSLEGEPLSIKNSGTGNLYVLTRTATKNPQRPFTNTLYNIPFESSIGAMFDPSNIHVIARTEEGIFETSAQFFDIAFVSTGSIAIPQQKEQLVLATSQGLYYSTADQTTNGGIADALTQTNAQWVVVDNSMNQLFNKIYSPSTTPIQHTVLPLAFQDQNAHTYDRGSIQQFSGNGNNGGTAPLFNTSFIPQNFNVKDQDNPFKSFFGHIFNVWSDGARRLFVINSMQKPPYINVIASSPFDRAQSNLLTPLILTYPVLKTVNHIYWISAIGSTGLICAGTDQGIIALS